MGLTKIEKIQIIGHRTNEEEVIGRLQELGLVQFVKPAIPAESRHSAKSRHSGSGSEDVATMPSADKFVSQGSCREEVIKKIAGLEQAIKYLESLEEKKGLLSGIIPEKIILSEKDFASMINLDQDKIQQEVQSIQEEFNKLLTREEHFKKELETFLPWLNLSVVLCEIKGLEFTELIPGTLPLKLFPLFQDNIKKEFEGRFSLEVVSQDEEKVHLLLAFLKEDIEKFKPEDYNFTRIELPSIQKTAKERIEEIEKELSEIYARISEIQKRAQKLKAEKIKLMVFYDYLLNVKNKEESKEQFFYFPHTFILDGWTRKKDLKKLTEDLKEKFKEIELLTVKPEEGEEPPVALENTRTVKPFEMLTCLYGTPNYKELDPTPLLAPFFIIYFGLCLTDAGYGIVLMLLMYIFIRRSKLKPNRLVYILFWGGLFTIFAGAITGGWFGDAIDRFAVFSFLSGLKKLMIFDPMKNPIIFLAIALALGFIQVCYGLGLKVYKLMRQGAPLDAFCDPFSQLMVVCGLPLLALALMKLLPGILFPISLGMVIFGIGNIFFYNFINITGGLLIRLFMGVYAIYSTITGCLVGDVLSFSRLLALGMATAGIAMAVNVMAQSAMDIPIIGVIVAILITVVGHFLNIVINAFGGFVHSLRLQYVEFFTKFYEGGGKEFRPFGKEYKYMEVKNNGED